MKILLTKFSKVVKCPTLVEVFSYIFFYPTTIVGPAFEFADFRKFINLQDEYTNLPFYVCLENYFYEFLKAFGCVVLYIMLKGPFDYLYCATAEFGEKSIIYKVNIF